MSNYLPCPACGSKSKSENRPDGIIAVSCSNRDCGFYTGFATVNLWQQLDRSKSINLDDVYKQFELSLRVQKEENDELKGWVNNLLIEAPAELRQDPQTWSGEWAKFAKRFQELKKWMEKHG